MTTRVHLTMKSRNAKVGPIPVSTTEATTCPDACPLKKNGCYADGGPLALFWGKVTRGEAGLPWGEFLELIKGLPEGQLWRHNQAGDLPGQGDEIHTEAFLGLIEANRGKLGFTYTHKPMTSSNAELVAKANAEGFTVNLSANNLEHADELKATNAGPVVVVVAEDHPERSTTPGGLPVVVCPEQTGKAASCAECGLCAKANRAVAVGFRVHGVSKAKATRVINIKRAEDLIAA